MTNNAPAFDPLNCTAEEKADMVAGYMSYPGPPRPDASMAYAWGRRNRVNDAANTSDPEQRAVARRMIDATIEATRRVGFVTVSRDGKGGQWLVRDTAGHVLTHYDADYGRAKLRREKHYQECLAELLKEGSHV